MQPDFYNGGKRALDREFLAGHHSNRVTEGQVVE